jgi:hypothetical protein
VIGHLQQIVLRDRARTIAIQGQDREFAMEKQEIVPALPAGLVPIAVFEI